MCVCLAVTHNMAGWRLTLGAGVSASPQVTVAARPPAVKVSQAEALRGADGVITRQLVHARDIPHPRTHGGGRGGGGGQGGASRAER